MDLRTPGLFFELCISQGCIQNFERIWKNSVCIKKLQLSKLEYHSLCGKVDFSATYSTYNITICSFRRPMFSPKFCELLEEVTF